MLFVRSGAPANAFTYSAYSTNSGSPVPPLRLSVSPGGFIPDAANTSGNLLRMLTLSKQSCASLLFTSVTIIETSQPLHYTFGSYRHTCCIVHHLPTYRNAAYNRFDGEGCSTSPIERPALITKAASLDTHNALPKVRAGHCNFSFSLLTIHLFGVTSFF